MMGHDFILKRINLKRKSKKVYLKDTNSITKKAIFVKYPEEAEIFSNVTDYFGCSEIEQKLKEFEKIYGISVKFVNRSLEFQKNNKE